MKVRMAFGVATFALTLGTATVLAQRPLDDAGTGNVSPVLAPAGAPSESSTEQAPWRGWEREVWAPVVRLASIAVILGALLWWLELKSVLPKNVWSERTIVALAIVFTFCAAALMNVANQVFVVLKDVALVVIGFYFGAAKDRNDSRGTALSSIERDKHESK